MRLERPRPSGCWQILKQKQRSLFQESRLRNIAEAYQGHNYMHCPVCAAKSEVKSSEGIHVYLKFIEGLFSRYKRNSLLQLQIL